MTRKLSLNDNLFLQLETTETPMHVGAMLTFGWQTTNAKSAEDYVVPVASGIIAGVSIVGVLVALANTVLAA